MPLPNARDLTDAQWAILAPLIPEPPRRSDGRGCPWKDRRSVLNGILWMLRTGAPWSDLPERYPSYQTCHRRFVREAFIDGSFAPAKKGAVRLARRSAVRGQRSWPWQTGMAFPWPCVSKVLRLTK
jgi:transposase